MIHPKAIDHTCLWVSSLDKAKDYYEALFDVQCRIRTGDTRTLVVESPQLRFFISEGLQLPVGFLRCQHLSFEVNKIQHVIDQLKKLGINDYETGEVDCFIRRNYKWCEWRDPDGIRLECVEIKPTGSEQI